MQRPDLTCVTVNCQGSGIITSLLWVEVHRYLHGIANPKSPNGGINRERAATRRGTSGLLWDIWGLRSFCRLAHSSSPVLARGQETTVSSRKREHTGPGTEPPTQLLKSSSPQKILSYKMTSSPPYPASSFLQQGSRV